MKYFFGIFIVLVMFFAVAAAIPESASAQTGLVTCSGLDCNFCKLASMTERIVNFIVGILVLLSVILLAITGIQMAYTAAGSGDARQILKERLINIVIGFVLILGAWVFIDTMIKLLVTDGDIRGNWRTPVGDICEGQLVPEISSDYEPGGIYAEEGPGVGLNDNAGGDENGVRNQLETANIGVNKDPCPAGVRYQDVQGGCTSVGELNPGAVNSLVSMKNQCDTTSGGCDFELTGGSELGHAGETNVGTHGGGDKFDLSPTADVNNYINSNSFQTTSVGGRTGRQNNDTGTFCVRENPGIANDHWDCKS